MATERITSSGRIVSYNFQGGTVSNTAQTIASGTGTSSTINIIKNNGSQFTASTGVFIPVVSGFYEVVCGHDINISGLLYIAYQIYDVAGAGVLHTGFVSTSDTTFNSLGSCILYGQLVAGQSYTIRIQSNATGGGSINLNAINRVTIKRISA